MLRAAMIGLQAAKAQVCALRDPPGGGHPIRPWREAATAGADVDFDEDRQPHACVARRRLDQLDAVGIVSADRDPAEMRERRKAREFARADDFVADEYVANAAPGKDFRFRHLLHTLADGAARHLHMRDDG